jgi:branched-chain amino acid transport system permease protein
MGSLMGTAFLVLLPEVMETAVKALAASGLGQMRAVADGIVYFKEMAIGLSIILFLIFEPDGLAHRWRQTKAYWKLYPFSY